MFNKEQIFEAGYKFKEEILKLKQELLATKVGTLAGDKIIADALADPNIEFKDDDNDRA